VSLDESFSDNFWVENEDFEELIEDWFVGDKIKVKQGETYILALYLKIPYKFLNTIICKL